MALMVFKCHLGSFARGAGAEEHVEKKKE